MTKALLVLALFGCSKKSDEPKPAEPKETAKPVEAKPSKVDGTPAVETKPEPIKKATTCAPGAWTNGAKDHPRFCLALPKDFALADKGPEKRSHHEWRYEFKGTGESRPSLAVTVFGIAKPGVASSVSAHGPNDDEKKIVDETLPNGRRFVTRPADYDKEEYASETEFVSLTKGEAVDVSKECGSCPPWEWVVECWSSTPKAAAAADRTPCKSLQMP